jgi:hypothetical protein
MKKYLGIKVVSAEPMTRGEAGKAGLVRGYSENDENCEGYKVVYEDGYESWSPKSTFEKAYRLTEGLTFGDAIEALKNGKRVARKDWNGKGMFLYLTKGSEVTHARDNALDCVIQRNGVAVINPHIDMKAADDTFVIGWLASQTDILSEDWEIVE